MLTSRWWVRNMKTIRVILATMRMQMASTFARPLTRFCMLVYPVIHLVLLYEMYDHSGEQNFTSYVILSSGLAGTWYSICYASGNNINHERWIGTLPSLFVAPVKFVWIICGKIIGNTVISLSSVAVSFLLALLLFDMPVVIAEPLLFAVSLLLVIICFSAIATLFAYLITLSRKSSTYIECINIPISLLCGFLFPIEVLPRWPQYISWCLSPTWAVKLMRLSVAGFGNINEFLIPMGILLGEIFIYIVIFAMLYRKFDNAVRVRATLEVA